VITIGIDPHKHTHTAVAVKDATGQLLAELTVSADEAGHERLRQWATELAGGELRFALEDIRQVSGRLERSLLAHGCDVRRVPPKLMADMRRGARQFGKSDAIDALAIARAALREPGLPAARSEPELRELKLLIDHRENLLRERTALASRLRWHLHDIDSGLEPRARSLGREGPRRSLAQRLARREQSVQVRICRELLARIGQISRREAELAGEIRGLVRGSVPALLKLPGCAELNAAKLIAEIGGADRFSSDAQPSRGLRADRGLLGAGAPAPTLAGRQPPAQRRLLPHRAYPVADASRGAGLPGQKAGRGKVDRRGLPLPKASPGQSRLASPSRVQRGTDLNLSNSRKDSSSSSPRLT